MILFHRLLPFLAIAAWAGVADAQVPDRRAATLGDPDTRPAAEAGEIQVTDVTLRDGRLGLIGPDRTQVAFLPTGVYTTEGGTQLVIEDGAIRQLGRVAVRSTAVTREGVRLRMVDGGTVAIPDGTYLGGPDTGSLTISGGRPSRFRLPGVEQGVHDVQDQPSPVARNVSPATPQRSGGAARGEPSPRRMGAFSESSLIVRGSGELERQRQVEAGPEPANLTTSEIGQLLGSLGFSIWGGAGPWTVSTDAFVAEGRAELIIEDANQVGAPFAHFIHYKGRVYLNVYPSVLDKGYLIDCKVSPGDYRFWRMDGSWEASFSQSSHLLAIWDVMGATEGVTFIIEIQQEEGPGGVWKFYSCEITRLQQTP